MVVKHIQIYSVHISRTRICKSKKKSKVNLFTAPDKSFFGSYHHPLWQRQTTYSPQLRGWTKKLFQNVLL